MAEQNGDELSEIDTAMLQGAFAQLAAVVLTNVRACGKSAFCACKIMIVYASPQRLAFEPGATKQEASHFSRSCVIGALC